MNRELASIESVGKDVVVLQWFSFFSSSLTSTDNTGIQDQLKLQLLFCSVRDSSGVDWELPSDRYEIQRGPGYGARRRGWAGQPFTSTIYTQLN